jgi:uncharacterized delta-60 repeat protein
VTNGSRTPTEQTGRFRAGRRLQRRVSAALVAASLAATGIAAVPAAAAPGELDTSFNGSGIALTDFNPQREDQGLAMALQKDGKIVVVGTTDVDTTPVPPTGDLSVPTKYEWALMRDNADGGLDGSFGTGGKVRTAFGALRDTAFAVAIQADGMIVVGGNTFTAAGKAEFALARYKSDGGLDPNFGTNGKTQTPISGNVDGIKAIAIQADGKIVAAGISNCLGTGEGPTECTAADTIVARYRSDGTLDSSFSGDGKARVELGGGDAAQAVAIQSDGGIVVAGNAIGDSSDFMAARFKPDGSLDTSFSGDGKVTTAFNPGQTDLGRDVALQPDGRIVVGGVAANLSGTCPGPACVLDENFALVRYNFDGSLDSGFGTGGKILTQFTPGQPEAVEALTLLADGRIIAAGRSRNPASPFARRVSVARYTAAGTPDTTFGTNGLVTTAATADNNEASSVAIQADGKIVVAGYAGIPGTRIDKAFIVVRYQGDGTPPLIDPGSGTTTPPSGTDNGYWLAASDGGIFSYGKASFYGSTGNIKLAKPIVGMSPTRSGKGYWLVASDGGIFSYGDAAFHGSTGDIRLNKPIVGMSPTPSGKGYWLVASDGGIFAYGDADFYGSTGNISLVRPIVTMVATPSGKGYWLVASDGGIFAYGDARFFGSTGDIRLNKPIVGMAATRSGAGYWMVASDGGIFAYGDAAFHGSTGNIKLVQPIVGMTATKSGGGYYMVASDGGIFAYGDAKFLGSTGNIKLNKPIIGMAAI